MTVFIHFIGVFVSHSCTFRFLFFFLGRRKKWFSNVLQFVTCFQNVWVCILYCVLIFTPSGCVSVPILLRSEFLFCEFLKTTAIRQRANVVYLCMCRDCLSLFYCVERCKKFVSFQKLFFICNRVQQTGFNFEFCLCNLYMFILGWYSVSSLKLHDLTKTHIVWLSKSFFNGIYTN